MADGIVFCSKCGAQSAVRSAFCSSCGAAMNLSHSGVTASATDAERSPTSRSTYVLLAVLLPCLLGIGGLHNIVAGYRERGALQLVLSGVFWLFGVILAILIVPLCIGIPAWIALVIWCICDAVLVTKDAQGRPMQ